MPALWHSMIGYLDTIDTPELFVTALDAIQYLTSAYPEQFMQNHFQVCVPSFSAHSRILRYPPNKN